MTLESSIQASVIKYARSKGLVCVKQGGAGRFGSSGWPDFMVCGPRNRVLWIEFKKPGGKLTELQRLRHTELLTLGFQIYIINNTAAGKATVDAFILEGR